VLTVTISALCPGDVSQGIHNTVVLKSPTLQMEKRNVNTPHTCIYMYIVLLIDPPLLEETPDQRASTEASSMCNSKYTCIVSESTEKTHSSQANSLQSIPLLPKLSTSGTMRTLYIHWLYTLVRGVYLESGLDNSHGNEAGSSE
jgi:hypothetical protein